MVIIRVSPHKIKYDINLKRVWERYLLLNICHPAVFPKHRSAMRSWTQSCSPVNFVKSVAFCWILAATNVLKKMGQDLGKTSRLLSKHRTIIWCKDREFSYWHNWFSLLVLLQAFDEKAERVDWSRKQISCLQKVSNFAFYLEKPQWRCGLRGRYGIKYYYSWADCHLTYLTTTTLYSLDIK